MSVEKVSLTLNTDLLRKAGRLRGGAGSRLW